MIFEDLLLECKSLYDLVAVAMWKLGPDFNLMELQDEFDKQPIDSMLIAYKNNRLSNGFRRSIVILENNLKEYLSTLVDITDACYYLIIGIDRIISQDKNIIVNKFINYNDYRALNSNYLKTRVYIYKLPDYYILHTINEAMIENGQSYGLRNKIENNKDNYMLKNIKVCFEEDLRGFDILFKTLSPNNYISKSMCFNNRLNIAISPFVCHPLYEILKQKNNDKEFWFTEAIGYGRSENYSDRYFKILKKALLSSAHIIMFPEMILTEEICHQIEKEIKSLKIVDDKIIVAGTISREGTNKCLVYNNKGQLLFEQHKTFAFYDSHSGLGERLKTNKKIIVLDIEYIGRILIYICRDINYEKLQSVGKLIGANFILMPAYSRALDIASSAKQLAFDDLCITAMANSCSAFNQNQSVNDFVKSHKDMAIGAIVLPSKMCNGNRDGYTKLYKCDEHCRKCEHECLLYQLDMQFDEIEQYSNTISCKVDINRI